MGAGLSGACGIPIRELTRAAFHGLSGQTTVMAVVVVEGLEVAQGVQVPSLLRMRWFAVPLMILMTCRVLCEVSTLAVTVLALVPMSPRDDQVPSL
jgi:hypothetical protein